MTLITIKKIVQEQAIEINSQSFYLDAISKLKIDSEVKKKPYILTKKGKALFSAVITLFFDKVGKAILNGERIITPIGSFYMIKRYLNPDKNFIDHGATRKARAENPNAEVVYRTDEYYYKFYWSKAKQFLHLKTYYFKACFHKNRAIKLHKEILDLHVV